MINCYQALSLPEIIVHVENICKKTLTRLLLQTELVHLVVHVDRLPGDLLSRATHSQEPRKPLQKHWFNLKTQNGFIYYNKYRIKSVLSIEHSCPVSQRCYRRIWEKFLLNIRCHSPTSASRGSPRSCGGSWAPPPSTPRCSPPSSWCSWSRCLEKKYL